MLKVKAYIKESPNKGHGIFSEVFIPKGTIIWEFVDGFDIKVHKNQLEILDDIQKEMISKYFWREGDYLYSSCDFSIFQNHSDNPNSVPFGKNQMIASRDIFPGDEITVNYSDFDEDFKTYENTLI